MTINTKRNANAEPLFCIETIALHRTWEIIARRPQKGKPSVWLHRLATGAIIPGKGGE
jgi:hypothetical protein